MKTLDTQLVAQEGTRTFLREHLPGAKLPAPGRCTVVMFAGCQTFYEVSKTEFVDNRGKPVYEVKTLDANA